MRIEDRWENRDDYERDLLPQDKRTAEILLVRVGLYVSGELKITLSGPRSGRSYRVPRTRRMYTASAPGEPPAVMLGNLRLSAGSTPPQWDGDLVFIEWGVGLGVDQMTAALVRSYAPKLEFGGVDASGVRMEARPFMEPTAQRVAPRVARMLEGKA